MGSRSGKTILRALDGGSIASVACVLTLLACGGISVDKVDGFQPLSRGGAGGSAGATSGMNMAGVSNASGGTNAAGANTGGVANAGGAVNTGGTGNTAAVAGTSGSGASAGELGGETLTLCGDNELFWATPPNDVELRVDATYDGRPIEIRDFDDPLKLPAVTFTISGVDFTEVYFAFSFDDLGVNGNVGVTSNGNDTCSTYAAVWPGGGSDFGASTLKTTTFEAGAANPVTTGSMHLELPASAPLDTVRLHVLDATFSLPAKILKLPIR